MLTLADIVSNLGFILAIDHCARGCAHCPAFGDRTPVQRAPYPGLAATVAGIAAARRRLGLRPGVAAAGRVVHCWRISDPLDYVTRLPGGDVATCADVAALWRVHLGQGLYVVTNGSEGSPMARRALTAFADAPDLVSQVKLTITHADRSWDSPRYIPDLAWDVAALAPLWGLPSTRTEDPSGRRFRINVKTTPDRLADVRALVVAVLVRAGLSRATAQTACDDQSMVRFKPIYDLGNATGAPSPVAGAINLSTVSGARYKPTPQTRPAVQYGIRPDGRLFTVNLYAFTEHDLGPAEHPLYWPVDVEHADLHTDLGAYADA
jgi:hypothetical protein